MSKPDLNLGVVARDHTDPSEEGKKIIRRWRGKVYAFGYFDVSPLCKGFHVVTQKQVNDAVKREPWKFATSIELLNWTTLRREGLI